ncbi:MAG: dTDP-glucose 4,6-dehydratase [Elusimicrobia bacterium RIFOXYA2_FULL_39_19]|nr:MAG: dTDP-glucose 4,6-dehydratase [Elusimicrobia bacterium RIFOXYA2_FULL_39_19]
MKVLVTGGAGFIGSHIVEHFSNKADTKVAVMDNLRSGFKKNIEKFGVEFIEESITDYKACVNAMKGVDYVFHLAAMISVPESIFEPVECINLNAIGTINLIKAAKESGTVKKIVLSSSAAVYGDNPVMPKVETMLPEPKSPYAVTKLDGEYYLSLYRKEWGVPSACCRYFNVFGPRQNPKSQYAAAVPIFILKAIKNEDILIYGDGEQTRDFVYVKDVVQANVLVSEKGDSVYNVAYGSKITINELAEKIIKLTGSKSKIIHEKERPGDIKHSLADNSKIKKLGFKPSSSLEEGLKATVEFFVGEYKK